MVSRVSQENAQVLAVGTPKARVSQENLQVLAYDVPTARVSQLNVQVLWFTPFVYPAGTATVQWWRK